MKRGFRERSVPFIVLSSEATVDSAIKALRNGAQDYLTKPIDMNRLMQSIRQTLEQAAEAPHGGKKPKRNAARQVTRKRS